MAVLLSEMISQLRAELTEAMRSGSGSELKFELGPVELELTVAVEKSATPGAKIKFWVVELGADAKAASTATQRIKLSLDPRLATTTGRPLVSGDRTSGER